jgi:predicted transcriptional regulator
MSTTHETATETAQERMIAIIRGQSANATWEDIMYQLYVARKIEAGIAAADAGRVVPHEVIERMFGVK